ncbi:unnamed protein product [Closterium sp. NIES-64]|nr:unnamed protein product [Closterium sp. NIES-64]
MADLHCEFASLGVDDTTAHNHSTEAHKNESHEAPIAASSAAGEDGVDDLFARLSRDVREAPTEQQRLDAIVSTLFAANAMCFWPDSDAHRPQRAFGFRVLRTLPPAEETLEMRGTFFLMERSNERAPSSPDWESFSVVKSLGARSARVNVLPHLLPWLSASAAASLRHGSCATLLDYHSTQTKFEGTNVHSSLCPPSPPSLVAATVFYPVSLISRLRPLTLVYVPDSKLPSPHRPPAALATAPALAPSTPPSPSSSAVVPLSPTPALVALDITLVRASPRRLPSRLTPSKPVEISLIRDIISFVSQRASTNAAKEGLLNASVQELADTDVHGLSDEDVKELNCMLKTWGVDADAKQLDTVVDEYGRTAVHVAARDGDIFVVQALLGLGMPVSMRCNNRSTPMHRAAWGGHVACMKLLQRYGADIRACTNKCCECTEKHLLLPPTVFLSALLCTVQLLLAYYSLPPTFSPSFIPSSHCRSARSPRCAPPCATPTGTPLHDAARQGKWEAVKWLAQQGIDPQEVETNPSPGVLPFDLLAVEVAVVQAAGEVEVVGVVVGVEAVEVVVGAAEALGAVEGVAAAVGEEGAVVVVVLFQTLRTPLHDAARQGKWEAVEWLAHRPSDWFEGMLMDQRAPIARVSKSAFMVFFILILPV